MIPTSFAPMIIKLIMPKLTDNLAKIFKLDKILSYVEMPNELDIKVKKMETELNAMRETLIEIGKDSHPPQPFDDRITALEKQIGK